MNARSTRALLLTLWVVTFLSACGILHPKRASRKADDDGVVELPRQETSSAEPPIATFDEPPRSEQQAATLPPPSQQLPAGDWPSVDKKKEAGKKSHKTVLDPLDSALQRALEGSSQGHMSYNPPDKMTEGQTVRVTVQLLRPDAQGKIVSSPGPLLGPGSVQSEDLAVSEEMHLTLISVEPGAFDIAENDTSQSGIQTILPGYGANWYWDVTPKISGNQHLLLVASIVVRSGQDQRKQDLPAIQRTIFVSVLPPVPLSKRIATGLLGFLEKNWKWLLGVLPLGEIIRRLLKRFRSGRKILTYFPDEKVSDHDHEATADAQAQGAEDAKERETAERKAG